MLLDGWGKKAGVCPASTDIAIYLRKLKLSTTRLHVIRAILESIAYMSRSNMELIEESGIEIRDVVLSGGSSKSSLWNQIKADVMGRKVRTVKNQDSGCLGAAILAGVGSGVFASIEDACDAIIEDGETFAPDPDNLKIYCAYFNLYKKLYENVKALFQVITHFER